MEVIASGRIGYVGEQFINDSVVNGHQVVIVDNFSTVVHGKILNLKINKLTSRRPRDPERMITDSTLVRQSIGWSPNLSIQEMLASGRKVQENEKLLL
jgi:UDP-glucose 4-epimerase